MSLPAETVPISWILESHISLLEDIFQKNQSLHFEMLVWDETVQMFRWLHPSLIQERDCWDAGFCMVILAILHLSTAFPWVPPWQAWIIFDSKLQVWVIFLAQFFRKKEPRILEPYLGYSDLAQVWLNLNKRNSLPVRGTSTIGFVGNRALTSGCTLLTLKHWGWLKEILFGSTTFK